MDVDLLFLGRRMLLLMTSMMMMMLTSMMVMLMVMMIMPATAGATAGVRILLRFSHGRTHIHLYVVARDKGT